MNISFIGYGSMAHALASKWGDYPILFGGRNPDKAADVADPLLAGHGDTADAAAFGDVVVLATPHNVAHEAIEDAGGAHAFHDKIVLDINNPVDIEDGFYLHKTYEDGKSFAEHLATLLPHSHIVKAFNMCQAKVWQMKPPHFDGRPLTTFICGDDKPAKETVAELVRKVGAEPHDLGPLIQARKLEAAAAIVIQLLFSGKDPHTVLNLVDA